MIPEQKIGLLIDADNITATHSEAVFENSRQRGEVTLKRAYGDFTKGKAKSWVSELNERAITPVQHYAMVPGKNASDILLVIDAIELAYAGEVDAFVIVSSDSDFTRLSSRLQELGYPVYGMGVEKNKVPIRSYYSDFIALFDDKSAADSTPRPTDFSLQNAAKIIEETLKKMKSESGWYSLSPLGKELKNKGFDKDSYPNGRTLTGLIKATEKFDLYPADNPNKVKKK